MTDAKFQASGYDRWLNCPMAARWEAILPRPPQTKSAADGTAAHSRVEKAAVMWRAAYFGHIDYEISDWELPKPGTDERAWVDALDFAVTECGGPESVALIGIEEAVNLSTIGLGDQKGIVDAFVIGTDQLWVLDYKSGKFPVDSKSPQLLLYAAALLNSEHVKGCEPKKVVTWIVQPSAGPQLPFNISPKKLLDWVHHEVGSAVALAREDAPVEPVPGDHCRFCRARAVCGPRLSREYGCHFIQEGHLMAVGDLPVSALADEYEAAAKWARRKDEIGDFVKPLLEGGASIPGFGLTQNGRLTTTGIRSPETLFLRRP